MRRTTPRDRASARRGCALVLLVAIAPIVSSVAHPSVAQATRAQNLRRHSGVRDALSRRVAEIDRDHVFVRFRGHPVDAPTRLARAGARSGRAMAGTQWTAVATAGDALAVKSRLEHDPEVAQVALSYVRHASTVPNDPRWASAERDYLAPLRMDRAWDRSKGDNVTIAVVDTGVDAQHPDLAGRVLPGASFVPTTNVVQDDNGHGTMVAGILAATSNNARGIAGIAPHARILPVKVLDSGGGGNDPDIADGIRWAADHGANVINLSLGGPGDNIVLDQAIAYAQSRGVIVVAAAGNGGAEGVDYPGAVPGVIAVSATTHSGALTAFSSYGTRVDIAAPGLDITTTALSSPPNGDVYTQGSGTSFSTPIVAGVVALVRAQNPSWSAAKVVQQVLLTARDVGPPGVDRAFGHGIVDPLAALGGAPLAPAPALPPGGDEPNDTASRATHLTFSQGIVNYSAEIAPETDEDWYAVTLSSGWWNVHVPSGAGALDHNMDPLVQLYDMQGRLLASQEFAGGDLVFNAVAGDYLVRVRNRGGDTAPYTLSISGASAPPVFAQALPVDLLSSAQSVGIGDLNGDGRNDLAFLMGDGSALFDTLIVLNQTATRSFVLGSVVYTPLQQTPGTGLVVADVTGDARPDVLYPTTQGIQIVGQTAYGLQDANFIPAAGVAQLAVKDVDGDGHADVVATSTTGTRVYWGPNLNTNVRVSTTPATGVALGDVNADGRVDVITNESGNVSVYRQTSSRVFVSALGTGYTKATNVAFDDTTANVVVSYHDASKVRALHYSAGAMSKVSETVVGAEPDAVAAATIDGTPSTVTLHDDSGYLGIVPQSGGAEQTFLADDQPSPHYDTRALAVGDIDGDNKPDAVVGTAFGVSLLLHRVDTLPPNYATNLVADVNPAPYHVNVAADAALHLTLQRAATNASSNASLLDAHGTKLAATVAGDGTNAIDVTPSANLASGAYTLHVDGLIADNGDHLDGWNAPFIVGPMPDESAPDAQLLAPPSGIRTTAGVNLAFTSHDATAAFLCSFDNAPYAACTSPVAKNVAAGNHSFSVIARDPAGNESAPATASWTYRPVPHGYWMVGAAGSVYPFGTVLNFGSPRTLAVQDLDVSPSGYGYWIVDAGGHVYAFGDARWRGNANGLGPYEMVTSISRTASGQGYWLFTNLGRAFAFGDAKWYGDMRTRRLNAPVLDSVTTPSGRGYYMVAADGGVFTFGDAKFYGSTGSMRLPAPVRTLTPDPDGAGYWLVGTDGSVYSFNAAFHGSMTGKRLNKPIVGMVAYGHGYLMVAADGGIFNFSGTSFLGSLGSAPPPIPIVSVAAFG